MAQGTSDDSRVFRREPELWKVSLKFPHGDATNFAYCRVTDVQCRVYRRGASQYRLVGRIGITLTRERLSFVEVLGALGIMRRLTCGK